MPLSVIEISEPTVFSASNTKVISIQVLLVMRSFVVKTVTQHNSNDYQYGEKGNVIY